jgi:signal transduction histidine kinase
VESKPEKGTTFRISLPRKRLPKVAGDGDEERQPL